MTEVEYTAIYQLPSVEPTYDVRAILDHKNGHWSIATCRKDGTEMKVEQTYTFDELRLWAEAAFQNSPEAKTRAQLGRMLAAGVLTMMVGLGIIQTNQGDKKA